MVRSILFSGIDKYKIRANIMHLPCTGSSILNTSTIDVLCGCAFLGQLSAAAGAAVVRFLIFRSGLVCTHARTMWVLAQLHLLLLPIILIHRIYVLFLLPPPQIYYSSRHIVASFCLLPLTFLVSFFVGSCMHGWLLCLAVRRWLWLRRRRRRRRRRRVVR